MNSSGIYPTGDKILVQLEDLGQEITTEGGIIIPEKESEKYKLAQVFARIVYVSALAWDDWKEPFAKEGDRVMIAKYGGLQVVGKDGEEYKVIHDTDVTALVDDDVKFSDLTPRERVK